ncbi:Complex 1 LYR [Pyrenophora seminiperda CCB06]|uniref:Complex 1 LYR n=1 Tax=Pyrenophora seminiperda CCB06 TaxID=1302712 RepID=A0A3M7MHV0_9PLEO|nr:Complex 1 LYR [Pyrenophora seminiperda CCB06]
MSYLLRFKCTVLLLRLDLLSFVTWMIDFIHILKTSLNLHSTSNGETIWTSEGRAIALPTMLASGESKAEYIGKKDFGTIEYLLRRGRNQLESWSDPGIRDIRR